MLTNRGEIEGSITVEGRGGGGSTRRRGSGRGRGEGGSERIEGGRGLGGEIGAVLAWGFVDGGLEGREGELLSKKKG